MNSLRKPELHEKRFICMTCKTEFKTMSTSEGDSTVETCSNCHPAYTGKLRTGTPGKRLDWFKKKYGSK